MPQMIRILMIDNYDSFTYNLVDAVVCLPQKPHVDVVRNDQSRLTELEKLDPSHVIISPGPGRPEDAGISLELIENWSTRLPILGVCLGHQCMAQVFGYQVERHQKCMHGKTSIIHHDNQGIFQNIQNPFTAMRYHSLIVCENSRLDEFSVSARSEENEIMAIRHKHLKLDGVQFHPESFATPEGKNILKNFISK